MGTLLVMTLVTASADMNDVDMADTASDTSSTRDLDADMDNQDPNLHNPQPRHGYGDGDPNPKDKWEETTTAKPKRVKMTTTPPPPLSFSEQSYLAALELGIIVGVALMVGSLFMLMVWLEMLCDKAGEQYRECFKKQVTKKPYFNLIHFPKLQYTCNT